MQDLKKKAKSKGKKPAVTCPVCHAPFVLDPPTAAAEAAFRQLAADHKYRACRKCGAHIEKESGCDKMRCRCGTRVLGRVGRERARSGSG